MLGLHAAVGIHGQHGAAVDTDVVVAAPPRLEGVQQPYSLVANAEGVGVVVAADDGLGGTPRQDLLKEAVVGGIGADALAVNTEGILVACVPAVTLLAVIEGDGLGIYIRLQGGLDGVAVGVDGDVHDEGGFGDSVRLQLLDLAAVPGELLGDQLGPLVMLHALLIDPGLAVVGVHHDDAVDGATLLLNADDVVAVAQSRISRLQQAMLAGHEDLGGLGHGLGAVLVVVIAEHGGPGDAVALHPGCEILVGIILSRPGQIAADGDEIGLGGLHQTVHGLLQMRPLLPDPLVVIQVGVGEVEDGELLVLLLLQYFHWSILSAP